MSRSSGKASQQVHVTYKNQLPKLTCLSVWQQHRSGRNDDSSDEDERADESGPLHGALLDGDDSNVHRDLQGNVVQPSFAFCRALDNEEEYDDVDAVAGTSLRGTADIADLKPHRLTEVATFGVCMFHRDFCNLASTTSHKYRSWLQETVCSQVTNFAFALSTFMVLR